MCFKVTSIPSPYNMNLVYSFWVSTIGGIENIGKMGLTLDMEILSWVYQDCSTFVVKMFSWMFQMTIYSKYIHMYTYNKYGCIIIFVYVYIYIYVYTYRDIYIYILWNYVYIYILCMYVYIYIV